MLLMRPPSEGTRCEWCGAEYDPAAPPADPAGARRPPAVAAGSEPVTHCEWCGAEYPTPDAPPEASPGS
jgi:hypothetical protein